MKKIFFPVLFFCSFQLNAQLDSSAFKLPALTDSTGFGAADGKLVSKEIGAAGGNIISEDGRIELIFPAGALLSNTAISIQPTTNPLFSGAGKAYRCEPSGIQFKKPVQLVFHYTKKEAETCPPDLMNIGMQDHTGKWSFASYELWDSTANTLQGFIHHFSGIASTNRAKIVPEKKSVSVEGTVNINFYDNYGTVQSGPFVGTGNRLKIGSRYWAVNGVRDGDDKVGHAGPPRLSTAMGAYTAPKIIPERNPVVVHFFFEYYSEILGKEIWGVVSCDILVYDAYKITVVYQSSFEPTIIDSAGFVATISDKVIVTDIRNYRPTVGKLTDPYATKSKITVDASCVGIVNLEAADFGDYDISNDYPPEILFELPLHKKVLVYKVQYFIKKIPGPVESAVVEAMPHEINFIANGQNQTINYTYSNGKIKVRIIAEPIRTN